MEEKFSFLFPQKLRNISQIDFLSFSPDVFLIINFFMIYWQKVNKTATTLICAAQNSHYSLFYCQSVHRTMLKGKISKSLVKLSTFFLKNIN